MRSIRDACCSSAGRRRGLITFKALWPEVRSHLHEVTMLNRDPRPVDAATVREVARLLEKRIEAVDLAAGCPACHESLARRFVIQLRRLAEEATGATSPGKAA